VDDFFPTKVLGTCFTCGLIRNRYNTAIRVCGTEDELQLQQEQPAVPRDKRKDSGVVLKTNLLPAALDPNHKAETSGNIKSPPVGFTIYYFYYLDPAAQ
jgi:hypothetical protein